MPGQVQVGDRQGNLFGADARRPVIIDFHPDAKRLLIHHAHIQNTLPGSRARLQLGVDLFDIRVLPENLQSLTSSSFRSQRRLAPPAEVGLRNIAVAQPECSHAR